MAKAFSVALTALFGAVAVFFLSYAVFLAAQGSPVPLRFWGLGIGHALGAVMGIILLTAGRRQKC
jgi:hypothetical protein